MNLSNDYLTLLRGFVMTASTLSFVEAADKLGLTPPTLSRQIKKLEDQLEVQLLVRTTRSVKLSEAGERYLKHAQNILSGISTANAEAKKLSSAPSGKLTVTVPLTFGRIHMTGFFNHFLTCYPNVKLNALYTDSFLDMVNETVDVAVRIGNLADSSLRVRRLGTVKRRLVASPAYLDSSGPITTPSDLHDHKLLHFSPLKDGRVWRLIKDDEPENVFVSPHLLSNDATFLLEAAISGQGIALLADFITDEFINNNSLQTVLDDWSLADVGIFAVYPQTSYLPETQRAFIDQLVLYFSSLSAS